MNIKLRDFLVYLFGIHVVIPIKIFRITPDKIDDRISIVLSMVYVAFNGMAIYFLTGWSNWGVLYSVWMGSSSLFMFIGHKSIYKTMGPDPLECPITGELIREGDKVELDEDVIGTMGFDEAFQGRWVVKDIKGANVNLDTFPVSHIKSTNFGLKKISREEYDSKALELF